MRIGVHFKHSMDTDSTIHFLLRALGLVAFELYHDVVNGCMLLNANAEICLNVY